MSSDANITRLITEQCLIGTRLETPVVYELMENGVITQSIEFMELNIK